MLPLVIGTIGAGPYGVWLFLIAISSYFNYSDLGVGTAIIHFGSRARSGDDTFSMSQLVSAAILWTSCIGLVVVPIYGVLSWNYVSAFSDMPGLSSSDIFIMVVMSILVAAGLIIRPFSGALIGSGKLLLERRFQLIGVLVRIIGTIFACMLFGNVGAVAIAETVALLTPTALSTIACVFKGLASVKFSRSLFPALKTMMSFSMRSFSVSISSALISNGGTLVMGLVGTPVQVTYFAAATRVLNGVGQITSWAYTPFQPALTRLFHSAPHSARSMLQNLVFSSFSVSALTCGILMWAAHPGVALWLGPAVKTEVVATTIVILLCGAVLNSLQAPMLIAAEASGKPGLFFVTQFAIAVTFVGSGVPLGAEYGAIGVALARLIPIVLLLPAYVLIAKKHFSLHPMSWLQRSVFPAFWFILPATVLTAIIAFASSSSNIRLIEWAPAVVFSLSCLMLLVLVRHRLPLSELKAILRTPM